MFDVGGGELLLIVLAIILLFGKDKMPETVQMIKKGVSQARKAQAMFKEQLDEIKTAVDEIDEKPKPTAQAVEEPIEITEEKPKFERTYKPVALNVEIGDNLKNENNLQKDNENIS